MGLRIALVGATGAVGAQFLDILASGRLPVASLRLLASARSAGKELSFRGQGLTVQETAPDAFRDIDVAFVSATTEASRRFCPAAVAAGAIAIDDSSAFRLEAHVPLVIPEVNPGDLERHQGIIATPNCTTVPLVMVLHALLQAAPITRVVVSTYQSVSGAGASAVRELDTQTRAVLAGDVPMPRVFPHQIAFNAIPQVDSFQADGYTKEEWKMEQESRKILGMPGLRFSATCVRVPVYQAHSMAVSVEFGAPVSPEDARRWLVEMPGITLVDDPPAGRYPQPVAAAGRDEVFVGRIRKDTSCDNGIVLWLSADNLRNGAALNAVQIVEELLRRRLLPRG